MNKGRQNNTMKRSSKRKNEVQPVTKASQPPRENTVIEEEGPLHFEPKMEEPLGLIDETFIILDKISRTLNEPGVRGLEEAVIADFKSILEQVKEKLTLEQIHNLQYSNRLSYILDLLTRKGSKLKSNDHLLKLIQSEVLRVEGLYQDYFSDFSYLQEVRKQYLGSS